MASIYSHSRRDPAKEAASASEGSAIRTGCQTRSLAQIPVRQQRLQHLVGFRHIRAFRDLRNDVEQIRSHPPRTARDCSLECSRALRGFGLI
jgi:hypothetical protein